MSIDGPKDRSDSPGPDSPSDGHFSAEGDGEIYVDGLLMIGEHRPKVFIAEGTGKIYINGGISRATGPNDLVAFPTPDGRLSAKSTAELRQTAIRLAKELAKLDEMARSTPEIVVSDFLRLRPESLMLCCELYSRIAPVKRRPLPLHIRCGIDSILYARYCGTRPGKGIGDFLVYLLLCQENRSAAEKFLADSDGWR